MVASPFPEAQNIIYSESFEVGSTVETNVPVALGFDLGRFGYVPNLRAHRLHASLLCVRRREASVGRRACMLYVYLQRKRI